LLIDVRANGKAQPQRRVKRVYFNSCPRTNAGSPIQRAPKALSAAACVGLRPHFN
jgi:hypothetical protein